MKPPYPGDEPRRFDDDDAEGWRFSLTPGGVGLLLFLLSLTIFFLAAMVGYVVIRVTNPHAPDLGQMTLPMGLWVSTGLLLISGLTVHLAQRAAVRGAADQMRTLLMLTLGLGVAFVGVQVPSLHALLSVHFEVLEERVAIYGLTAVLIGLHGVHVVGGVVPLAWLTWRSVQGGPSQPGPLVLRHMEFYWHFLHVVWVLMFLVFLILG